MSRGNNIDLRGGTQDISAELDAFEQDTDNELSSEGGWDMSETEDLEMVSQERSEFMEIIPIDLEDIHEWINDLQGKDMRILDEMIAEYGGLEGFLHLAGFMPEDVEDWLHRTA